MVEAATQSEMAPFVRELQWVFKTPLPEFAPANAKTGWGQAQSGAAFALTSLARAGLCDEEDLPDRLRELLPIGFDGE